MLAHFLITWLCGKQNAGKFKLLALNLPPSNIKSKFKEQTSLNFTFYATGKFDLGTSRAKPYSASFALCCRYFTIKFSSVSSSAT